MLPHMADDHSNFNRICTGVSFSSDGKYVATGGLDMVLKIWRVPTGEKYVDEAEDKCKH